MSKRYLMLLAICLLIGDIVYSQDLENLDLKTKAGNFFSGFTDAKPFQISGTMGLNMRSYNAFDTENRQAPFIWHLHSHLNISIYKLKIPVSALISSQNQTISHPFHRETFDNFKQQRFTRIGASPYYKWIKLHAGHRSMNFSPFTVANHTYLGAGIELTPGNIRFATFYGGMAKTQPRDLSLLGLNREIFNRKGLGVKAGYGTNKNFIDFILFKGKDDPNQIDPINQDSSFIFQNDNAVLGINGQVTLFKRLNLRMEIASSGFTKNAIDPETEGTNPPIPNFLLNQRTSTVYRQAINAGLSFDATLFTVGMGYRRIEPDYQSLGAYFFNNDLEDYTLNLGFGLLNNRLHFNGTGGLQKNNLFGEKATQLNRTIASANINYAVKTFTAGLSLSNYSSAVDYVLNLEQDSLNAIIVTQSASLNTSYMHLSELKNRHLFSFNFSIQEVTDDVDNPSVSAASQMINAIVAYNFTPSESAWKFNSRINYNRNELSRIRVHRYGLGLGVERKLIADKWFLSLQSNYFYSTGENIDNQTLSLRMSSPFRINKHHRIDFSLLYLNRLSSSNNTVGGGFQEVTGILNYVYSF
ncbi:MAG: hypothetical protein DHS20C18_50800 [Saprospiraceae bacterium]|nr:MAG: hypothetical protein DHS20C18_50800 [Saprospiraceae bacterium]